MKLAFGCANCYVTPPLGRITLDDNTRMLSMKETLFFNALERIQYGSVEITLPNGVKRHFTGLKSGPEASLVIRDRRMLDAVFAGGDIGFGESYMRGDWETDDLCSVMHVAAANADYLGLIEARGVKRLMLWLYHHILRRDTLVGSGRNARDHYDLSNAFYRLWLDDSMTYTSAYFPHDGMSLEEAQDAKHKRILQQLGDSIEGASVLDIGCGWGAFVAAAARKGMRATGINISYEQMAYAQALLTREGLNHAEVVLRDYRDEQGTYDHIVSIEMIDHVQERSLPGYFEIIRRSLRPKGNAIVQSITIADSVFDAYRKRCDFIQRHIFPGGMLPSDGAIRDAAARAGLKISDTFDIGSSYARTMAEWLKRFDASIPIVRSMGFPTEFIRKWRFYLGFCYGGFMSKRTGVAQYLLNHA